MIKGHGAKLGWRKEAAIIGLLLEPSFEKAAKRAGVSESTLWRWLRLPEFQEAYRSARRESVSQAIGALQRASSEAVEALRKIMKNTKAPATARVNAARSILEFAIKGMEIEDILARLEALENEGGNN
jgi:integrase